jgi:hypothetical protein
LGDRLRASAASLGQPHEREHQVTHAEPGRDHEGQRRPARRGQQTPERRAKHEARTDRRTDATQGPSALVGPDVIGHVGLRRRDLGPAQPREQPGHEQQGEAVGDREQDHRDTRADDRAEQHRSSADAIAKPTAVRYAYDTLPKINFYNKEGLPAVPFTTVD